MQCCTYWWLGICWCQHICRHITPVPHLNLPGIWSAKITANVVKIAQDIETQTVFKPVYLNDYKIHHSMLSVLLCDEYYHLEWICKHCGVWWCIYVSVNWVRVGSGYGFFACWVSSHYLNQCWPLIWTLRSKLHWKFTENSLKIQCFISGKCNWQWLQNVVNFVVASVCRHIQTRTNMGALIYDTKCSIALAWKKNVCDTQIQIWLKLICWHPNDKKAA